ncbi:MAG: substrate-binding domain-containing protein [Tissierellia bacterium]|nr:substrate-binding domain-containing protein [Tissierellia bacterium]
MNTTMKRFLGMVLVVTMLLTLFVGCSPKEQDVETEKTEQAAKEETTEAASTEKAETTEAEETEATKTTEAAEDITNSAMKEAEEALLKALEPLPEKDTGAKLGAIESTLSNPFWITMQNGYEDAAEEYGVTIEVKATTTETDLTGQLDIMNAMIAQEFDAIAISPLTEQNLIPGIVEANKADIKVVTVGNNVNKEALDAAEGVVVAHVTSDFKLQGQMGADFIIEKLNGEGKVAVIEGIPGATQSEARKNGALEAFEAAGMEVLPVVTANFDRQAAYDATLALITANPDLKGITCGNDIMALGAIQALKESDMKEQVFVVGVDFIDEARESIKNGELDATVAMSPYLFGKGGTIVALKAIRGDEFNEDIIWTPQKLVEKGNVDTMEGWK